MALAPGTAACPDRSSRDVLLGNLMPIAPGLIFVAAVAEPPLANKESLKSYGSLTIQHETVEIPNLAYGVVPVGLVQ
jgi:hypothetical protein